jgi:AcrR family transcriptional regulator
VSATPSKRTGPAREPRQGPYHHGDLKAALVDGAIELIAERGLREFSLAKLTKRLGVTVAAPYRHFADRDELLAAVAVRALHAFADALMADASGQDSPEQQLAAMTRGYVRFAAEHRPLFDVVYGSGLDKARYPEMRVAYERVEKPFEAAVAELCPDDPSAALALGGALEASAHGNAIFVLDGLFGEGPEAIDRAAAQAAAAALALIQGRSALGPAPGSLSLPLAQFVQDPRADAGRIQPQVGDYHRGEVAVRVTLGDPQQAKQHVLGADVAMVQRPRLLQRHRQRQLGRVVERQPADPAQRALRGRRHPLERARAEALLDPALDLVQVDADRRQGLGVAVGGFPRRGSGTMRCFAYPGQFALDRGGVHAQCGQRPGAHAIGGGHPVQHVYRADLIVTLFLGLGQGEADDLPGPVGESFEHVGCPLGSELR